MVRIVIPVEDKEAKKLSAHFGRAPYFGWFDILDGKIVDQGVKPNDSSHFGGQGLPPERMMAMGADVVISAGMGQRAIQMFQNSTVAVLQAKSQDVKQCIWDFEENQLTELTQGCLHAYEHEH
jgi:predicted Fe-Mo cluster-binding NifX family protein